MQWAVACIILGVANDNATTRGGGNSSFKRRSAVGMGPMGDGSDGWSVPNDLEVPASVLSRTGAPTVAFDHAMRC